MKRKNNSTIQTNSKKENPQGYQNLVDLNNFAFRFYTDEELKINDILDMFDKCMNEDKVLTIKWLFYLRDINRGLGDKPLFRLFLEYLGNNLEIMSQLLEKKDGIYLIPYFGRWDDLLCLLNTDSRHIVVDIIRRQLDEDLDNMSKNKNISNLAKWMPSVNTSSRSTRKIARYLSKQLGMKEKEYRQMSSNMRGYLKVTERLMSNREWKSIDYNNVPHNANHIYNNAFLRHDKMNRISFIYNNNVCKLSNTFKTYKDVHMILDNNELGKLNKIKRIEKKFNYNTESTNIIVIPDMSKTMYRDLNSRTNIRLRDIAIATTINYSRHLNIAYRYTFMNFSELPQFISLFDDKTLLSKINKINTTTTTPMLDMNKVCKMIHDVNYNYKMDNKNKLSKVLIITDKDIDCIKLDVEKLINMKIEIPEIIFWNLTNKCTIKIAEYNNFITVVNGYVDIDDILKMNLQEYIRKTLCNKRYDIINKFIT